MNKKKRADLLTDSMKLEGQRFLLYLKLDQARDFFEYDYLNKQIKKLTERIELHQMLLKEMKE